VSDGVGNAGKEMEYAVELRVTINVDLCHQGFTHLYSVYVRSPCHLPEGSRIPFILKLTLDQLQLFQRTWIEGLSGVVRGLAI
jgi:hypothetical protein